MNLLFTCSGRRHYLLEFFKQVLGNSGLIIAIDNQATAPSFAAADLSFEVASIYHTEYIQQLKDIISRYRINAVIPLNDLELPILSNNKMELEKLGCHVIVSDSELVRICSDKWETFQYLKKIGINTPLSYLTISDTLNAILKGELRFPVVLKPRWGSGSFGIEIAENKRELQLAFELLKIRLERSFLKNMNIHHTDKAIIIQEKLNGEEYGMDVVNDFKGNYVASFSRKKLAMRSGETDKAETIIEENFTKLGEKIAKSTKHLGLMDIDFFKNGDKIHVLELNPRFGGGYPFSHYGGANVPAMYIDWLMGLTDVSVHNRYKASMVFSKHDSLVESHYAQLNNLKV